VTQAAAAGATVLLSNYSEFDDAVSEAKMLAGRGDGPHPFDIGSELGQRYFEVTRNGARAAQIRLEGALRKCCVELGFFCLEAGSNVARTTRSSSTTKVIRNRCGPLLLLVVRVETHRFRWNSQAR